MRAIFDFLHGIFSALVLCAGLVAVAVVVGDGRGPQTGSTPPPQAGPVFRAAPVAERPYPVSRLRAPIPAGAYAASYLEPAEGAQPGVDLRTLRDGSGARAYRLILPRRAWAGQPLPALVLLHEQGRSGASMLDIWGALAEPAGLILIAPDAAGSAWRGSTDGPEAMRALLAAVEREVLIDRDRVYLFGHGDGAGHALWLANLAPDLWRAVAVHGGAVPPQLVTRREGTLPPVTLFVGTLDGVYPPPAVHRSAAALAEAGHAVSVTEIDGHTNWIYDIGPWISQQAWQVFRGS